MKYTFTLEGLGFCCPKKIPDRLETLAEKINFTGAYEENDFYKDGKSCREISFDLEADDPSEIVKAIKDNFTGGVMWELSFSEDLQEYMPQKICCVM